MRKKLFALVMGISVAQTCFPQGTFQNLDFEEANPAAIGSDNSAAVLFPDWQVYFGTSQSSIAGYDVETLGAPFVEIWDDKTGYTPIQGNYTAFLQSATVPIESESVSLSQTGLVPTGTESIQLDANQEQGSSFVVSFDGAPVNMVPLQTFPNYTLYGGDVSQWAGQNADLSITELPPSNPEFSPNLLQLDNISFSPVMVTPEPDALTLIGIGGALFAAYRRFAPKR